jgi:TetR/AcrR family transcriptional repressor of nem operon
MARPRAFDEEAVLDAATACFWHRGYAATSVRDLADSMRLTPPSLYNAFGDKAALFALVLDRYVERVIVPRIDRLATEPPLEAVRRFLAELVDRAVTDPERRGCLLVNAAVELAAHDETLAATIRKHLARIERFFRKAIQEAQAQGSLSASARADDLAHLLLSVVVGIRVLARARPERALLDGIVRTALATIESPPQPTPRRSR